MIPFCGQEVRAHKIDNKAKQRKTLIWSLRNAHVVDFPLDPAEVRQDKNRVVGGGIGPSFPHTSYIFDNQADQRKNL